MFVGASATFTGRSHTRWGTVCQDATCWESSDDGSQIVGILCDGAGSYIRSEIGAQILCEKIPGWLFQNSRELERLDPPEFGRSLLRQARRILESEAASQELKMKELSSTLLLVWARRRGNSVVALAFHLGDGINACITTEGQVFLTNPKRGEFANETCFVTSKDADKKFVAEVWETSKGSGFLLMSDGAASSLFLKSKKKLAPACAEMLGWLSENESEVVEKALEKNLDSLISQKTGDDCGITLLLDRDPDHPFAVNLEHPQPPEPEMNTKIDYPKKLIEVSIPLQEINEASAREKSIRHGHPSTLHLWWARRPLAAARAVLFCQLVDDPSGYVDELMADKLKRQRAEAEVALDLEMTPQASPKLEDKLVEKERERLHKIVKDLVIWENTTNETVLNRARKEIRKSWERSCKREGKPIDTPMPPVLDPFAGGGAIPLEAQRLGMEAHASDLNPVAVLINKAMIEIPPKFAGMPPVNPEWQAKTKEEKAATMWKGAQGLADDVRYYGEWMRKQAEERIGHLYPKYEITEEIIADRPDLREAGYKAGDELTVIAWLWARTVPSPNPALNEKHVPLISSYWLSKKKGKEAYVEPVLNNGSYIFQVRVGKPNDFKWADSGTKSGRGAFHCLLSGSPFTTTYVQECGVEGKLGQGLFAVVCEGKRGRLYLNSSEKHTDMAFEARATWAPSGHIPRNLTGGTCAPYGLDTFGKLFTERQLVALTTFSDLVGEARDEVLAAANTSAKQNESLDRNDERSLEQGGRGPLAYADAVAVYLGLAMSRMTDRSSTICGWDSSRESSRNTFGRQAIPMSWDFLEANLLSDSTGNFSGMVAWVWKALENFPANKPGRVDQLNASTRQIDNDTIVATDPPYYDNIGYADLSDYFYVWIRRSLRDVLPFSTSGILVPKDEELIASPYRQGGKDKAEEFFLNGMSAVAATWAKTVSDNFPTTIYYAFKQAEVKSGGIASTGWATFLGALIESGFGVVGTWPVRTEMVNKIGHKANMLASSIVLVCRTRSFDSALATRREFVQLLQRELPEALRNLLNSNIAPVDLPQSAIGPGMAIFSRFSKVVEADGSPMSVTSALQLINKAVDEILSEQEAEMDEWTRFAVTWFSQYCFNKGPYGDAEQIATARDVAVDGVATAGIIESGGGKVRAFRPEELPEDWDPREDSRLTVWEIVHHLIRLLDSQGESAAATILAKVGGLSHDAHRLCYQLYTICENKGWAEEGRAYNTLIAAWPELVKLAEEQREVTFVQGELL